MSETKQKLHNWTSGDDDALRTAISDCEPIFEHYRTQNKKYTELNAWDAVAGRLLPDICVTGAACRRRWEIIKQRENSTWDELIEVVDKYERELAETTFDGVSEILGNMDALFERLGSVEKKLDAVMELWK